MACGHGLPPPFKGTKYSHGGWVASLRVGGVKVALPAQATATAAAHLRDRWGGCHGRRRRPRRIRLRTLTACLPVRRALCVVKGAGAAFQLPELMLAEVADELERRQWEEVGAGGTGRRMLRPCRSELPS